MLKESPTLWILGLKQVNPSFYFIFFLASTLKSLKVQLEACGVLLCALKSRGRLSMATVVAP